MYSLPFRLLTFLDQNASISASVVLFMSSILLLLFCKHSSDNIQGPCGWSRIFFIS
jgi:hypothetical protein